MAGRHVALIRGINVGRAKRVAMADLRALLEGFGYGGVRTVLNSGNAVFTARVTPAKAAARIENGLATELGVPAHVAALALGARVAYLWCPEGILASRLADSVNRALGDAVTTRNWATVLKVHAVAASAPVSP